MASIISVDNIRATGTSTNAVTIDSSNNLGDITMNAEGGTGTLSVRQGVAKSWINYDQASNVVRDSLNISSVVDNSTSEFEANFTNVTNNIYYSVHGAFSMNYAVAASLGYAMHTDGSAERAPTTSDFFARTINFSGSGYDAKYNMLSAHGDLA